MLTSIWNVLRSIGEFFSGVAGFILDTIKDLMYMIKTLSSLGTGLLKWLGWLPASFVALVSIAVSFVIIYKILGREG